MVLKDTLYNQEKNKEITRKEMNYEFEKTQALEKAGHENQLAIADIEIKKQTLLKNSQEKCRTWLLAGRTILGTRDH